MVSNDIVEDTWRAVAGLSASDALKEMEKIARRQRELLVFVTSMCEELSERAQEIAIYVFVVVYRMFERSRAHPLPKAKRRQITSAFERVDRDLGKLIGANERFMERQAVIEAAGEPFVMRYISGVLVEPDDPDSVLPDEEIGEVFIYLKTVVDVLHEISASE